MISPTPARLMQSAFSAPTEYTHQQSMLHMPDNSARGRRPHAQTNQPTKPAALQPTRPPPSLSLFPPAPASQQTHVQARYSVQQQVELPLLLTHRHSYTPTLSMEAHYINLTHPPDP